MNFWNKYYENLLTIEDQKEALIHYDSSYWFAKANIPGSNFKALQEKCCEDSCFAYLFAKDITVADIEYCQRHACKDPKFAFLFAKDIFGANIKYCQQYACKDPHWSYLFAIDIPNSDKKYCLKHAFPEDKYGPDIWKSEYNKFIMQKACE